MRHLLCPRCCCQLFTWIISFYPHNQHHMVATTVSSIVQMEAKRENPRQYNLSMKESEFHSRRSGLELLDLTTMLHYPLFQPWWWGGRDGVVKTEGYLGTTFRVLLLFPFTTPTGYIIYKTAFIILWSIYCFLEVICDHLILAHQPAMPSSKCAHTHTHVSSRMG